MAAEHHFIYEGGGSDDIPIDVTHLTIDESVTIIPEGLLYEHPNIVELICHKGVTKIGRRTCYKCPSLQRVIMLGVLVVESEAFFHCEALLHVKCDKLERIENKAFMNNRSLVGIDLPSLRVVKLSAFFNCQAVEYVKFGKLLDSIDSCAFTDCVCLERITIPLKAGVLTNESIFYRCGNLVRLELVEKDELKEIIAAFHLKEWKKEMNHQILYIRRALPNAWAGNYIQYGQKVGVIEEWIKHTLQMLSHFISEHHRILNVAVTSLRHSLPNDIIQNSVLPFLKLPPQSSEWEGHEEDNETRKRRKVENA